MWFYSLFDKRWKERSNTFLFCFFLSFSQFSNSFPALSVPQAFFCPERPEHTARGNPCKCHAVTIEGLSESSCLANDAGPLRRNMAPERELKGNHVLLFYLNITKNIYVFFLIRKLTIWQRERLSLTSFSNDRISISSFPSKAFILSCLLANLEVKDLVTLLVSRTVYSLQLFDLATRGQYLPNTSIVWNEF